MLDSRNTRGTAIYLSARSNLTIRNLEIRKYARVAIQQAGANYNIYENIYLHTIGKGGNNDYSSGFELSGGQGNVIRNCRLDKIGTTSLHHGVYLAFHNTGTLIYGNYISRVTGAGVHAWHDVAAIDPEIYSNIITRSRRMPAMVFGDGSYDIKIYNNTLVDNRRGGIKLFDYGENNSDPAHDVVIRNNILYESDLSIMPGVTNVAEDHNVTTDPGFADAHRHDYRLEAGSMGVDTGVAIPTVATDIAGTPRPQGNAYDVGAFER